MMKTIHILFFLLYSSVVFTQTTIVLQPDAATGKDAKIFNLDALANYGSAVDLEASFWNYAGEEGTTRSLIQFDLSSVPAGEGIIDAKLSLYYNSESSTPGQEGNNAAYLRRIVEPWSENTVAWVQQPGYTTENEVFIPSSATETQDHEGIDVTHLVRDMIEFPNNSHGFMFMHHTETQIASMKFYSSDAPQINEHPRLEITYGTVSNKEIDFNEATIQPNPFTNSFIIRNLTGEYSISVLNISGKEVYAGKAGSIGNDLVVDHLDNLPVGMYFVKIIGTSGNYFSKIVKS